MVNKMKKLTNSTFESVSDFIEMNKTNIIEYFMDYVGYDPDETSYFTDDGYTITEFMDYSNNKITCQLSLISNDSILLRQNIEVILKS